MTEQALSQSLPASGARQGARLAPIVVASYVVAIVLAEATGVFVAPMAGLISHAILVLALLAHASLADKAPYHRLLPALALAPLLRIMSLIMPFKYIPELYWQLLIGIPVLVSIGLVARATELSREQIGLCLRAWPAQILIAGCGIPLGLAAALLLPARTLVSNVGGVEFTLGAAILILFSGFTEELLFRGVLLRAARDVFGRGDILFSTLIFCVVSMGALSVEYLVFVALVGLFFGWCARRTGSIWGVAVAHGLISVGVAYIWAH